FVTSSSFTLPTHSVLDSLSLHDALPICPGPVRHRHLLNGDGLGVPAETPVTASGATRLEAPPGIPFDFTACVPLRAAVPAPPAPAPAARGTSSSGCAQRAPPR